jgi:hypothetical protein
LVGIRPVFVGAGVPALMAGFISALMFRGAALARPTATATATMPR